MRNINTLIDKYPKLLSDLLFNRRDSFGVECGDGWFDLINTLCEDIIRVDPTAIATQVKEKFGTLRFYVSAAEDEVFDLIDKAEDASGKICEECGAPGKTEGKMWLKTICKKCKKESKYYAD